MKLMRFAIVSFLFAALALLTPASAEITNLRSIVPAGFSHAIVLTVNGYNREAELTGFPVLVRIAEYDSTTEKGIQGFDYGDFILDTGSVPEDLCFVSDSGEQLPYEIDTWNTEGESLVWVKLPSMQHGTQFAMCYGSLTAYTPTNPWGSYVGVWHMAEEATASVATIYDSTTNELHGTSVATSSNTVGKVGRARFITSNTSNAAGQPYDSGVTIDMSGDENAAKLAVVDGIVPEFTASFWVRPQNTAQWWYFITRKASDDGPGWGLQNGGNKNNASQADFKSFRAWATNETDKTCLSLYDVAALEIGKWVRLDAVWKTDKTFVLYTNGMFAATGELRDQATNGDQTKLAIGGAMAPTDSKSKNGRGVYGDMDEVRLCKGAMTADWIAADYATQNDEGFLSNSGALTPVTVTWDVNEGEMTVGGSTITTSTTTSPFPGDALVAPGNPEKASKVFVGWNTAPDSTEGLDLARINISVDTTLYAIFADAVVRWYDEDGTLLTPAFSGLNDGVRPTHAEPAKEGNIFVRYSFAGWRSVGGDGSVIATENLPLVEAGNDIAYKAVYNEDRAEFARGVKFTVAGYNGGTEVQTNFPVLVRLSTAIAGFDYNDFYNASVNPTDPDALKLIDIGFVDAEGNGLAYDIDTWNPSGESLVWVNLPIMTNKTEFAMLYRSSKTGKALNPDNVWTNYAGVWHFREDYGTETGSVKVYDSTTNQLTGSTLYNATTKGTSVSGGKVGRGRRMGDNIADANKGTGGIDVSLDEQNSPKRAAVDRLASPTPVFSASFWIYPEMNVRYPYYVSRKNADTYPAWAIQSNDNKANSANAFRVFSCGTGSDKNLGISGVGAAQNTWTKIDVVYTDEGSNGKGYFYVNGVLKNNGGGNLNTGKAANGSVDLYIGGGSGGDCRPFGGVMDEVRLQYGRPSNARIKADFDTVSTTGFLTAGTVVTNAITERPVVTFTIADIGASHIQFGGNLTSLGSDQATECTFYAKVWPTADTEPSTWSALGTGLGTGALSGLVKGLTPGTAYSYRLKVTNNEGDEGVDSYETADDFTTSGVGVSGTGGDVTRVDDDWIHYFRVGLDEEGAVTNVYTFTPPPYANTVRALVVAGGGPGGYKAGGGGGAGGLIYSNALAVTFGNTYTITVGEGGAASTNSTEFGKQGGSSSISNGITEVVRAIGGGAGGNYDNSANWRIGQDGGSGGGSPHSGSKAGAGTAGQGNAGGKGNGDVLAGGGGGAFAVGGSAIDSGDFRNAGSGGGGFECDISGIATFYAGGGGGGGKQVADKPGTAGVGGNGGGGAGSRMDVQGNVSAATQGVDGLGGGGGGGCGDVEALYKGGDGGDGIVIIRYASQGDSSTVQEPIISLKSAVCNDVKFTGDVTFRVAWAGYNSTAGKAYETANVKIKWGYSRNNLVHTTDVLVSNVVGIASASFDLIADECTVYCRAVAVNDANVESESTETLSFYVNDNPNAQEDEATPILADVGLSRVDALYAVVTGMVVSTGVSSAEPKTCKVRVKIGSTENNLVVTNEMSAPVGPFSLGIDGLNEQTTYYYCVEALDDNETTVDTDPESFTTLPAASVLSTLTMSTSLTNYTISGSLSVVGAGTTHIFVKWGEGEWEEIGAFNALSNDTSFSTTYLGTWDDSSITGQLMCSNVCERVDGTPAREPFVTTQNNSFSPVDDATYTWQPVDEDWNGDWNDPEHWQSSKAGRGYPDNASATADFVNCTTDNPVVVNVNGKYTIKELKYYGLAASDVTFAGTSTNESSLSASITYGQNGIKANSKVEFRDMTLTRAGTNWDFQRGQADATNILVRFSNVYSTGVMFGMSAAFSRLEFIDSEITCSSRFNFGSSNSVLVVSNSKIDMDSYDFHFGADVGIKGPVEMIISGKDSRIRAKRFFVYEHSNGYDATITLMVPEGGFAETPLQQTGSDKFQSGKSSGANSKIKFAVSPESPALRRSNPVLENHVIVSTTSGFETGRVGNGNGGIGEGQEGVPGWAFKWGASGSPLEGESPDLTTARQILLDLQGKSNGVMFLIY